MASSPSGDRDASVSDETADRDDLDSEQSTAIWRSGIALAIGGTFLFALKSIFIKLSFAVGASALELLTLRMLFAFPFYFVVGLRLMRAGAAENTNPQTLWKAGLLGFLGYYLASYLDLQGLSYISAQLERLTLFTYPAIVAILAWMFLGESLNLKIGLAIGLCYAGVALMFFREVTPTSASDLKFGVLLVMASALSYSLYVVFAKPVMGQIGSVLFTSLAMLGSVVFVGVHFVLVQDPMTLLALPPLVYVYAVVLAFVCTVIPSYMISEAIMRIGATRTTVIGAVGPVLTMLLAVALLREPTSWMHFAGMLLAILGVSLVSQKEK